ncbi:MAG: M28 family metallopeptidase [Pseudomonadales bacterium]
MTRERNIVLMLTIAMLATACGSNDSSLFTETEAETETDVRALVAQLASDEMAGRDNQSPGSLLAQTFLVGELSKFAQPAFAATIGEDGYLQQYDLGTNILAIVPGGELDNEYVMIGAHYDHLGNDCDGISTEDNICNGASDNAAGVAAVIDIVRSITASGTPRRSIIVTLWDGEEDNFDGSRYYVDNPIVPLEQTIAYVNFDIQGANLLPSLRNSTILVGAETGGANLIDVATRARAQSSLDTVMLSLLFGQGRSDHAILVGSGVPSVFFTDANNGCYHTVKDDVDAVDFPKLTQQIITADALTRELISTDDVPVFDAAAPIVTYQDAMELLRIVESAELDFGLLGTQQQLDSEQFLSDLQGIVGAGPDAFGDAAVGTLLGGAAALVAALAAVDCDPFLPAA